MFSETHNPNLAFIFTRFNTNICFRCGDVFGCRCVMIISELSSMLSYGSLSFATNVFMLFMSRLPALAMHNLQGSYMIITDITLPANRAKMLGILGVSHGLGE